MADRKTSSRRFLVVGHQGFRWVDTIVKASSFEEARAKAAEQFNHPAVGMNFDGAEDPDLHAVNLHE